jgi:hypothetical protein
MMTLIQLLYRQMEMNALLKHPKEQLSPEAEIKMIICLI